VFEPELALGTSGTLPGWPSLSYIPIEKIEPKKMGVNLYGMTSKEETLTVFAPN
jgi:hypothetical protein